MASRSTPRKATSPSSRKIEAIDRPKRSTIDWSMSTTSQSSRAARARLTVVFPVALNPMRTMLPGTDRYAHQDLSHGTQGMLDVGALNPVMRHHPDFLAVTGVANDIVVTKLR